MDDKEHDEILYRLDERTERVDEHLNRLEKNVAQNEASIDNIQSKVDRNTTILGGVGTIFTAVSVWVADKVSRFV
jgi:hypothetical protein